MTNTFEKLGLSSLSLQAVRELDFSEPTPVQQQAIPFGLEGRDILAAAQTGTGKTLAYLLPIFDQMIRYYGSKRPKSNKGPYALILSPTRELASQIADCARTIGETTNFRVQNIIGGKKYATQIQGIQEGCDILIATPGRLLDLMDQKSVSLDNIHYLVLDEVDRMMDMGFWPSVNAIIKRTSTQRQTFLFSATLTPQVLEKARILQNDPERIEIAHCGETATTVEEYLMPVSAIQKQALLEALLKDKGASRVLIFTHTKREADACANGLRKNGIKADSIHSDKTQSKRDKALRDFKMGKIDVLVATDVLARGIDITEVGYVVNYNVPDNPEDYVHRIGRTGRAGIEGYAFTFLTPDQLLELREIEYFTNHLLETYDLEGFEYRDDRLVPNPKRPTKRATRKSNSRRRLSFRRR